MQTAQPRNRGSFAPVHGKHKTPAWMSWVSMITRCTYPKSNSYCRYGARGIKVCDRWLKFENFLADMGERPAGRTLDRIDNNGNYEPQNCRWASLAEQGANRRNVRTLSFNGETKTLSEWAKAKGMSRSALQRRLNKLGWSAEKTLLTPPRGSL
jgi:hypothetical protein